VPFAKMVANRMGWCTIVGRPTNFLAELGEAYAYIVDGMDDLYT
jgi:hypothetical protein